MSCSQVAGSSKRLACGVLLYSESATAQRHHHVCARLPLGEGGMVVVRAVPRQVGAAVPRGRRGGRVRADFFDDFRVKYADGERTIPAQLDVVAARSSRSTEGGQQYACRETAPGDSEVIVDTVYDGGSFCELTQTPRRTQYTFVCQLSFRLFST